MPNLQVSFASRENQGSKCGSSSNPVSPQHSLSTRAHSSQYTNAAKNSRPQIARMSNSEATEQTVLLTTSNNGSCRRYTETERSAPPSRHDSSTNSRANTLPSEWHRGRRTSTRWDMSSPAFVRSARRTPKLGRSMTLDATAANDRAWYDQYTSIDWVHDAIADGFRVLELRKRKGLRGRLCLLFDASQGWILVALIGCLTAAVAYVIDVAEAAIFDLKRGYCTQGWYLSRKSCCVDGDNCQSWRTWAQLLSPSNADNVIANYFGFVLGCILFAAVACILTLRSKTTIASHIASAFDDNLGADHRKEGAALRDERSYTGIDAVDNPYVTTYYPAAGSGVAEVKVILSGFVLHGYLGLKTLALKCPALVFSVASGMSLGKEGPYVHIATCIGNIACRMFEKYNANDAKRREVLSAAAASGVAVAFGSPLAGVLFSLEEVSYYFPPKTLFRTFFCCIAAALSLKFLNPYGTNKIVIFEVRYDTQWRAFELFIFATLGVLGGVAGAAFIKASRFWAKTFRKLTVIKSNPWFEVLLVALTTGLISFWNRYASLSVTELLFELASPCNSQNHTGLCPTNRGETFKLVGDLTIAFMIKAFLTVITFGIKVPAGIYVPSMVCGGILGRLVGHAIQYIALLVPGSPPIGYCATVEGAEHCVTPGVYALVGAGATMCGVTRLSVTLAVILFELTGSLDYVLPFAIGVLIAKWTADLIEPNSIYDLLIDMNSYPFMDNRHTPLFAKESELGDITPRFDPGLVIDVSISPYVSAYDLRQKLDHLHDLGEFDGALPVIRERALIGLMPAPDLDFALDSIEGFEEETLCLLTNPDRLEYASSSTRWFPVPDEDDSENQMQSSPTSITSSRDSRHSMLEEDFTSFVDPAPIALDIHSPLNLVHECFSKLGLRYICVVESGEYRGMVHKKLFVKYLKTSEADLHWKE